MNGKWLKRWVEACQLFASWSEDNSTKVGCVIVDEKSQTLLSQGWNGLPRGTRLTERRLNERPYKYRWFEHAERNAIYNAARNGIIIEGASMFVQFYPCTDCARAIIQSGITRLYTVAPDLKHPRWGDDFTISHEMFCEAEERRMINIVYYHPTTFELFSEAVSVEHLMRK